MLLLQVDLTQLVSKTGSGLLGKESSQRSSAKGNDPRLLLSSEREQA